MTAETETETAATETAPVPSPVLPAADFPDQDQATVAAPEAASESPQDTPEDTAEPSGPAAAEVPAAPVHVSLQELEARISQPLQFSVEPASWTDLWAEFDAASTSNAIGADRDVSQVNAWYEHAWMATFAPRQLAGMPA